MDIDSSIATLSAVPNEAAIHDVESIEMQVGAEVIEASNNNTVKAGDPEIDSDDAAGGKSTTQDKAGGKKSRKRKKHIYNNIRDTMEFYFSDANLSKDRFLMKLINENARLCLQLVMKSRYILKYYFLFSDVPLSTFLTFNKIKAMASTVEEIEKAIRPSEKLRLSEDGLSVVRRADLSSLDKRNPDECTIYVVSTQHIS